MEQNFQLPQANLLKEDWRQHLNLLSVEKLWASNDFQEDTKKSLLSKHEILNV